MVTFALPSCSDPSHTHMHWAGTRLDGVLNARNYAALLGFCQGNLAERSSFEPTRKGTPVIQQVGGLAVMQAVCPT